MPSSHKIVYKRVGETPLECLERFRVENGISNSIPMTYAGRLDPLAEGALLILIGEECKKKDEYLGFDKEYEVEILFGIKTDTYDPLGLITDVKKVHEDEIDFNKYICKFRQEYPAYSSKVIAMKDVPEELPSREVEIYSIDVLDSYKILGSEVYKKALEKVSLVIGDFRQQKIAEGWSSFVKKYSEENFKIMRIKVTCSSGTYMRSLANNLGGLAFSIKRTAIGAYRAES